MAIYDRGLETLEVWPAVWGTDEHGNPAVRPGNPDTDTPVIVTGALVQPQQEDVSFESGTRMTSVYRVICRKWPTEAGALVRWRGQFWDSPENAAERDYNRRVTHSTAYIHARETPLHAANANG